MHLESIDFIKIDSYISSLDELHGDRFIIEAMLRINTVGLYQNVIVLILTGNMVNLVWE